MLKNRGLFFLVGLVAIGSLQAATPTVTAPFARVTWVDDESALTLSGPNGRSIPAQIGSELPAGSLVRTGKTGVELQLMPNGSVIKLAANTSLKLTNLALPGTTGDNRLELVGGKLRMLAVSAANGQAGYQIRTGTAVCAVRGTDFARQFDPALKKDWLCVLDGLIDFSSVDGKQAILVSGGNFVSLAKGWIAEPAPQDWLDINLADINSFKTPARATN